MCADCPVSDLGDPQERRLHRYPRVREVALLEDRQGAGKVRRSEADRVVVEGSVPAIVPRELWEAAQARHGTRRFASGRPWHRPYLLSSLIECAHCGKRGHVHRQVRGRIQSHYVCGGYVALGRGVCEGFRVPTAFLDDAVIDGMQKRIDLVLDPEELRRRLTASWRR